MRPFDARALALAASALACGSGEDVRVDWSDARAIVAIDLDPEDRVVRVSAYEHAPGEATRIEASEDARTVVLGFARPLSEYGIDPALFGTTRVGAATAPLPPPDHALERDGPTGAIELAPTAAQVLRAREAVLVPRAPCTTVREVADQPLVEWEGGPDVELAVPYARRSAIVGLVVHTATGSFFEVERVVGGARTPVRLPYPDAVVIVRALGFAETTGTVWILATVTAARAVLCRVPVDAEPECAWAEGDMPSPISRFGGARWDGVLELWALDGYGALSRAVEGSPGGLWSWRSVRAPSPRGRRCTILAPAMSIVGPGRAVVGGPGGGLEEVTVERGDVRRETLFEPPAFMDGNCVGSYARLNGGFEALLRVPVDAYEMGTAIPVDLRWRASAGQPWTPLAGLDPLESFPTLLSTREQLVVTNTGARVVLPEPLRPDLPPLVCPTSNAVSGAVVVSRPWEDELLIVTGNGFGSAVRLGWFEVRP